MYIYHNININQIISSVAKLIPHLRFDMDLMITALMVVMMMVVVKMVLVMMVVMLMMAVVMTMLVVVKMTIVCHSCVMGIMVRT